MTDEEKKYRYDADLLKPCIHFFKLFARKPEGTEE